MEVNFEGTSFRVLQGNRVYIWKKDEEDEWQIEYIRCGVCNAPLGWRYGLEKFCPNCGTEFIGTINSEPPEETEIVEKEKEE